ncbi:MAG TPA: ATP-binding protein [Methylomirabilota bacterium]
MRQEGTAEPQTPGGRRAGLALQAREILALALLTLCVVALSTAVHLYHVEQIVWNSTLREADLVERQIYTQCVRTLSRRTFEDPRTVLSQDADLRALLDATVGYAPWLLYSVITDDKGVAIVHSDRKREGELVPSQRSLKKVVNDDPLRRLFDGSRQSQIYEVALPFNVNGKPVATIRLGIAMSLLRGRLDDAFWYTVTLGCLSLAAALVVAVGLSSVTLKPIRKLAEDMERLRRGEFDVGSSAGPKDEFGKLAYQLQLLGKQMESDRTQILAERSEINTVHAAVDQIEDGVLFTTADGVILFANRSVEMVLGRPARDAAGKHLGDVFPPDHPLRHLMLRALEKGEASRNAKIEIQTDGAPLELLASVFPVSPEASKGAGVILVMRDLKSLAVSARTFQSLIQYSAQLAALGQITSEVAHDVKNPLHAMVVRVAFLRERIPDQTPDVTRSLDVLEREIHRAAAVVDRFSEVVYPSDLARQPVDINAILRELTTLLQAEWQAKSVALAARLDPTLPATKGDEQMLRRAFMNLIVNACQAMPRGGPVTISTEPETEALLKVTIADTGVGIPPEDVERIFKMYYTTKQEGTGIGLALVRRVVDLHHGSIEIHSTIGQGTSVIVRLPSAAKS